MRLTFRNKSSCRQILPQHVTIMTMAKQWTLWLLSLLLILHPIQPLCSIPDVLDKLCRDARVLGSTLLVAAATSSSSCIAPPTALATTMDDVQQHQPSQENYLPRRLYPGTYKNYCGPTPEVSPSRGCVAHGWHGDNAVDAVDGACRLHDLGYCKCQSELLTRRGGGDITATTDFASSSFLSSAVALRFVTKPILSGTDDGAVAPKNQIVDSDYLSCIKRADQELLTRGIQLRSEQQRDNCSSDPDLSWFCRPSSKTLQAFEQVNLNIFLHNMDSDNNSNSGRKDSLVQWEHQRQADLAKETTKEDHSLSKAVSSSAVRHDEEEMLQLLAK